MIRPIALATVTAIAIAFVAGCSGRGTLPPAQSDTQVANVQLVTDIPIPPSATLDSEHSLILSDHDHWSGRLVMRFWQSTNELVTFYQTQMPAFGWELVMSATSESTVLSYMRGDRAATVQIEKSMFGLNSMVSVTVAPRQSGAAQPPSPGMDSPLRQPVRSDPLGPPARH
jgi:hypothetical protein